MHNTLKQLKRIAHEVRLTHDEKSAMRETLVRFMATHPMRSGTRTASVASHGTCPAVHSVVKPSGGILSPYALFGRMRNFKTLSLISLGGLVLGGSVTFAAEGALPGDLLYPVKTEINERVRGTATFTAQAKAAWEVRLVERRLEEMEKLATRPLSLEAKEATQKNLERYAERVKDRVVSFENKKDIAGATATTEQFMKVLRAHEVVAEQVRNKMIVPLILPSSTTSPAVTNENDLRALEVTDVKRQKDKKKDRPVPQKQGI